MVYEYNVSADGYILRMLQAPPRRSRRDKLKERALFPTEDGSVVWQFPTTSQTKIALGLWKSRVLPRLGAPSRKGYDNERNSSSCRRETSRRERKRPIPGEGDFAERTADEFKPMYPADRKLKEEEKQT